MRKSACLIAVGVCVLFLGVLDVSAKTPDGQTPSRETVCDNEEGAAYGLCNAYCEAMDCTDPNQRASDQGCESVRENFMKKTGRPLPCDVQCPCFDLLQLFADIESGAATVQRCVDFGTSLLVMTTMPAEDAIITEVPAPACSATNQPPPLLLTSVEALVCRVRLRRASEEVQGVPCEFPE